MVPFAPRSRKPASLVSLLALFIGLAFTAGPALAQSQTPEYLPGEVLIKFAPGTSQADIASIRNALGATSIRTFSFIGASHERITRLTVDQAIARYRGDRRVAYIEPNYVVHALETPNDPLFPQLWGM